MAKITRRLRMPFIVALILSLHTGCGTIGIVIDGNGGPGPGPGPGRAPGPRSYPSYRALKIPPGHLPPPGQCRVWYPRRPPGHQPPPVSCASAARTAGGDSWILFRDSGDPKVLEVKEKRSNGPGVEVIVNHYLID